MALHLALAVGLDRETGVTVIIAGPVLSQQSSYPESAQIVAAYQAALESPEQRARFRGIVLLVNNRVTRRHLFPDVREIEARRARDMASAAARESARLNRELADLNSRAAAVSEKIAKVPAPPEPPPAAAKVPAPAPRKKAEQKPAGDSLL